MCLIFYNLYTEWLDSLLLGFRVKDVVEVTEEEPQDLHDGVLRDLHFDTVEGDFQVFKGTW